MMIAQYTNAHIPNTILALVGNEISKAQYDQQIAAKNQMTNQNIESIIVPHNHNIYLTYWML